MLGYEPIWILGTFAIYALPGTVDAACNTCTELEYSWLARSCEATFIENLKTSSQPDIDCPSLYQAARQCAVENSTSFCYDHHNLSPEKYEALRGQKSQIFGDEELYCSKGGLRSVWPVVQNNSGECKPNVSRGDADACEQDFYAAFRRNPADADLCLLYTKTHECQKKLLGSCIHAIDRTSDVSTVYFATELSPAYSANPFCQSESKKIAEEMENIMDCRHHATSQDVVIPLVVICIIVVCVLIGFLWWVTRKEARKPDILEESGATEQEMQAMNEERSGDVDGLPPPIGMSTLHDDRDGIKVA